MAKLDIIIPVYNEDENIIKLLKLLDSTVICNFRILICYDNETDKTLKHLKNLNIIKNEIKSDPRITRTGDALVDKNYSNDFPLSIYNSFDYYVL